MKLPRLAVLAILSLSALLAAPSAARAAAVPEVQGTQEVDAPENGGHMLLVYGLNLTRVTSFELGRADGTPIAVLVPVFRGRTLVGLRIPATLAAPAYPLPGDYTLKLVTRSLTESVLIRLTGDGAEPGTVAPSALDPALRADLDDAATVGGESAADLHDAELLTGQVSPSRYSAYADLAAESRIGAGSTRLASGDHLHDDRYPERGELSTPGSVNADGNPVDWSRLRGVPAGLADGVDDTGASVFTAGQGLNLLSGQFSVIFGGTGTASSSARSDHAHDSAYASKPLLASPGGAINDPGNPVDWSRLKNVPAGFADGADAQQVYDYGAGLSLVGNTFSVLFAGTGSLSTVARSDHGHTGYLGTSGGETIGGMLTFDSGSDAIRATTGNSSSGGTGSSTGGIDAVSPYGIGVAGHGNVGLMGDLDGDGTFAVWGNADYNYQVGVYASTRGSSSTALRARNTGSGTAIDARSDGSWSTGLQVYAGYQGTGVNSSTGRYGTAFRGYSYRGTVAYLQVGGWNGTGLRINSNSYSRDMAVFQNYGSNQARINSRGSGYFNGGTMSWGADFAESVKSDRPAAEFEAGDVMVIDPKAPRQFALSRTAASPLVAGVVSTRPAMVGTTHDIARGPNATMLQDEVKVGIVGIVPTKVCTEGGAIAIGDLLVTSSTPGHAMKAPANPAAGTVVGKALAAHEKGNGKIEVLLMAR